MAYISQEEKKALTPAIKAVLKKYRMKGTISVRHNSTLVVKIKSGALDFEVDPYGTDVNVYWINKHYSGDKAQFLNELLAAMKGPDYFCHDDSMTDYFHRSHYTDIKIGWDKPYVFEA